MTNTNMHPTLLLTPQQAAKALAISPRKLWAMTASGEIPHVRLGRCVRYPIEDLQRFINGPGDDIRILLLDGEVVAAMKRTPAAGDFRANAAQQATCVPWVPTDTEVAAARQAAAVTGCVFAGVDLMYDDTGQVFVIEVNAVPGWRAIEKTCRIDVPGRLLQWLESKGN